MSSSKSDAPQPRDSDEPVPALLKPGYSIESAMKKLEDLLYQSHKQTMSSSKADVNLDLPFLEKNLSKNFKAFVRMNGYKRPPPCLLGRPERIIYEPPLHDYYSDLHYPMIKYASLALESYNRREGTDYKYVGLLKAYSGEQFADDYDIYFTASRPLVSDFDDVAFHAMIFPPADGNFIASRVVRLSIEKLSTPPQFSIPWLVTQPKPQ